MESHNYYVYITTNPQKTVLYTGATNDLDRRLSEHLHNCNTLKTSFTGRYFCYNLIYYECYSDQRAAFAREQQIKKWARWKKEELINYFNPGWRFLNSAAEQALGDLPVWTSELEENRPR